MDESFKSLTNWREARKTVKSTVPTPQKTEGCSKWRPPEQGGFKINVDASVMPGVNSFSVGMVLRGHDGGFVAGKTTRFNAADSVFEAETIGVREALSWIYDNNLQNENVVIESDSMTTVNAIHRKEVNHLEVGDVIDSCCNLLDNLRHASVCFVRKSANRVAHSLARYPCLVHCHVLFSSPPDCVVEAIMYDVSQ